MQVVSRADSRVCTSVDVCGVSCVCTRMLFSVTNHTGVRTSKGQGQGEMHVVVQEFVIAVNAVMHRAAHFSLPVNIALSKQYS